MSTTRRRTATTARLRPVLATERQTTPAAFAKGSVRVPVIANEGMQQVTASLTHEEPVQARVERLLRRSPASITELARQTRTEPEVVAACIRRARLAGGDVVNLGTLEAPAWFWRPGDEGATPDLVEAVAGLIAWRPLTLRQLVDATGARRNRISGALVRLRESGAKLENHGRQHRGGTAVWHLVKKDEN